MGHTFLSRTPILKNWSAGWFYALLTVTVLVLYAPAVRFGLIWDDPRFYQSGLSQSSLWQIFTSPLPPTYQFYRPLVVLYSRLLVSPKGVVNAPLAHMLQIGAHLGVTLLIAPVLRGLHFDVGHARLTALCFAIFPLSYYGVAWQQNQQPMVLLWVLLAVLAAHQFDQRRSVVFLGMSLAAYAVALLFQEGASLFVFVFFWLAMSQGWRSARGFWRWWPLLHLSLASLYILMWLSMPIQRNVTGQGFQPVVLAYFVQGIVFPVSRLLARWAITWPVAGLLGVLAAVWLLLTLGLWKWRSVYPPALSCVWIAAGLLPLWAGLSWEYVRFGPRLLYPAALGIAVVWGGWAGLAFTARGWQRLLGIGVVTLVLGVSLQQWWEFQRLFQVGTQHLARAVEVLSAAPQKRLLFVNFPDRLEIRSPAYPLGFWGLVLAPVVQDLADYARAAQGQSAEDHSLASFITGAGDRDAWPYHVDLRGVDSTPAELFEAALRADEVYLTDYLPDGSLRLREVGDIGPAAPSPSPLARFGNVVQLVDAKVSLQADGPHLRLVWRCLQPLQPDDTVFVHFWRQDVFIGGEDGDSLGGAVPLSAWQVESEIVDLRQFERWRFEPGVVYAVRVGVYNRTSGARYPVVAATAGLGSENGVLVGEFSVP